MNKQQLLQEVEALSFTQRVHRLTELGHAALSNAELEQTLSNIEQAGFYERLLELTQDHEDNRFYRLTALNALANYDADLPAALIMNVVQQKPGEAYTAAAEMAVIVFLAICTERYSLTTRVDAYTL